MLVESSLIMSSPTNTAHRAQFQVDQRLNILLSWDFSRKRKYPDETLENGRTNFSSENPVEVFMSNGEKGRER
jgi:hypothetical protein